MPQEIASSDERRLLSAIKTAVDYVDQKNMSPDQAVEKVARDEQFGPGMITMLGRAYNTGRQLGQWRANTSILDKLASYPLCDPAKIVSSVYPEKVDTKKEAMHKVAFDADYNAPPTWLPDERKLAAQRRDTPLMEKAAADAKAGKVLPVSKPKPEAATVLKRDYGKFQRAKNAADESRRHAADCEDKLRHHVADLTSYLKQAACYRLPYAQVEHAAKTYYGPLAVDLCKMAYDRAKLREPGADKTPVQKVAFDLHHEPFTIVVAAIKAARDVNQARVWAKEAQDYFDQVSGHLVPFAEPSSRATAPNQSTSASSWNLLGGTKQAAHTPMSLLIDAGVIAAGDIGGGVVLNRMGQGEHGGPAARGPIEDDEPDPEDEDRLAAIEEIKDQAAKAMVTPGAEKRALSQISTSAIGSMISRGLGEYPKTKNDLIEDAWLDLEDPQHQNELRKIKTHAMLNSMLTDPDDPISGHDPDKVVSAYNEIAQLAPRTAEHAGALKPLLRKRLAGHTEPFETKELTDIEKGITATRISTPNTSILNDAPSGLLG